MLTREKQRDISHQEAMSLVLEQGRRDPVWFSEHVVGGALWPMQREIVRGICDVPHARVAVKACHASGKTFMASRVVLSFFYLNPGAKILTTAPTWTGVKKLLWGEIHTAFDKLPAGMGGEIIDTELRVSHDWWAMGLSTDDGVKFQGHHGGKILVVIDEAVGVRPTIHEAIEGIRAGGDVRVLMLGNPTITSGPFYDAFTKDRHTWQTFTIDAFATPNLDGITVADLRAIAAADVDHPLLAHNPRPYLTTRRWVHEKLHTWTEESPLWQSRVRGEFPKQSEDALLSLAWLEVAALREIAPVETDEWEAGIDVAGPGEAETVLAIRRGPTLVQLRAWPTPDPRGAVLAEMAPYKDLLGAVKVDSVGQGYYFARHLEDNGYAGRVVDINVGEAASDTERYANWKAELYWALRMRAQSGDFAGLDDETATGQLAGIRYRHDARGRVVIEGKDEARQRGVPSPDRAEAIMLCYAPQRPKPKPARQVEEFESYSFYSG